MQVETNMDGENEMVVKRLSVPLGLEELMESLTKEVLRKKPSDIYTFASEHFTQLLALRDKGCYQNSLKKIKKSSSQISKEYIDENYVVKRTPIKIKTATIGTVATVSKSSGIKSPAPPSFIKSSKRNVHSKLDNNISPRSRSINDLTKQKSDKAKSILDKRKAKKSGDNGNADNKKPIDGLQGKLIKNATPRKIENRKNSGGNQEEKMDKVKKDYGNKDRKMQRDKLVGNDVVKRNIDNTKHSLLNRNTSTDNLKHKSKLANLQTVANNSSAKNISMLNGVRAPYVTKSLDKDSQLTDRKISALEAKDSSIVESNTVENNNNNLENNNAKHDKIIQSSIDNSSSEIYNEKIGEVNVVDSSSTESNTVEDNVENNNCIENHVDPIQSTTEKEDESEAKAKQKLVDERKSITMTENKEDQTFSDNEPIKEQEFSSKATPICAILEQSSTGQLKKDNISENKNLTQNENDPTEHKDDIDFDKINNKIDVLSSKVASDDLMVKHEEIINNNATEEMGNQQKSENADKEINEELANISLSTSSSNGLVNDKDNEAYDKIRDTKNKMDENLSTKNINSTEQNDIIDKSSNELDKEIDKTKIKKNDTLSNINDNLDNINTGADKAIPQNLKIEVNVPDKIDSAITENDNVSIENVIKDNKPTQQKIPDLDKKIDNQNDNLERGPDNLDKVGTEADETIPQHGIKISDHVEMNTSSKENKNLDIKLNVPNKIDLAMTGNDNVSIEKILKDNEPTQQKMPDLDKEIENQSDSLEKASDNALSSISDNLDKVGTEAEESILENDTEISNHVEMNTSSKENENLNVKLNVPDKIDSTMTRNDNVSMENVIKDNEPTQQKISDLDKVRENNSDNLENVSDNALSNINNNLDKIGTAADESIPQNGTKISDHVEMNTYSKENKNLNIKVNVPNKIDSAMTGNDNVSIDDVIKDNQQIQKTIPDLDKEMKNQSDNLEKRADDALSNINNLDKVDTEADESILQKGTEINDHVEMNTSYNENENLNIKENVPVKIDSALTGKDNVSIENVVKDNDPTQQKRPDVDNEIGNQSDNLEKKADDYLPNIDDNLDNVDTEANKSTAQNDTKLNDHVEMDTSSKENENQIIKEHVLDKIDSAITGKDNVSIENVLKDNESTQQKKPDVDKEIESQNNNLEKRPDGTLSNINDNIDQLNNEIENQSGNLEKGADDALSNIDDNLDKVDAETDKSIPQNGNKINEHVKMNTSFKENKNLNIEEHVLNEIDSAITGKDNVSIENVLKDNKPTQQRGSNVDKGIENQSDNLEKGADDTLSNINDHLDKTDIEAHKAISQKGTEINDQVKLNTSYKKNDNLNIKEKLQDKIGLAITGKNNVSIKNEIKDNEPTQQIKSDVDKEIGNQSDNLEKKSDDSLSNINDKLDKVDTETDKSISQNATKINDHVEMNTFSKENENLNIRVNVPDKIDSAITGKETVSIEQHIAPDVDKEIESQSDKKGADENSKIYISTADQSEVNNLEKPVNNTIILETKHDTVEEIHEKRDLVDGNLRELSSKSNETKGKDSDNGISTDDKTNSENINDTKKEQHYISQENETNNKQGDTSDSKTKEVVLQDSETKESIKNTTHGKGIENDIMVDINDVKDIETSNKNNNNDNGTTIVQDEIDLLQKNTEEKENNIMKSETISQAENFTGTESKHTEGNGNEYAILEERTKGSNAVNSDEKGEAVNNKTISQKLIDTNVSDKNVISQEVLKEARTDTIHGDINPQPKSEKSENDYKNEVEGRINNIDTMAATKSFVENELLNYQTEKNDNLAEDSLSKSNLLPDEKKTFLDKNSSELTDMQNIFNSTDKASEPLVDQNSVHYDSPNITLKEENKKPANSQDVLDNQYVNESTDKASVTSTEQTMGEASVIPTEEDENKLLRKEVDNKYEESTKHIETPIAVANNAAQITQDVILKDTKDAKELPKLTSTQNHHEDKDKLENIDGTLDNQNQTENTKELNNSAYSKQSDDITDSDVINVQAKSLQELTNNEVDQTKNENEKIDERKTPMAPEKLNNGTGNGGKNEVKSLNSASETGDANENKFNSLDIAKTFIENEQTNYQSERFDNIVQKHTNQTEKSNNIEMEPNGVKQIDEVSGIKSSPNLKENVSVFGHQIKPEYPAIEKLEVVPNKINKAAEKIQSYWRRHRTKRDIKDLELKDLQKPGECDELPFQRGFIGSVDAAKAAIVIQALFRGYLTRKNMQDIEKKPYKKKSYEEKLPTVLEVDGQENGPLGNKSSSPAHVHGNSNNVENELIHMNNTSKVLNVTNYKNNLNQPSDTTNEEKSSTDIPNQDEEKYIETTSKNVLPEVLGNAEQRIAGTADDIKKMLNVTVDSGKYNLVQSSEVSDKNESSSDISIQNKKTDVTLIDVSKDLVEHTSKKGPVTATSHSIVDNSNIPVDNLLDDNKLSDHEVLKALKQLDEVPIPAESPAHESVKGKTISDLNSKKLVRNVTVDEPIVDKKSFGQLTKSNSVSNYLESSTEQKYASNNALATIRSTDDTVDTLKTNSLHKQLINPSERQDLNVSSKTIDQINNHNNTFNGEANVLDTATNKDVGKEINTNDSVNISETNEGLHSDAKHEKCGNLVNEDGYTDGLEIATSIKKDVQQLKDVLNVDNIKENDTTDKEYINDVHILQITNDIKEDVKKLQQTLEKDGTLDNNKISDDQFNNTDNQQDPDTSSINSRTGQHIESNLSVIPRSHTSNENNFQTISTPGNSGSEILNASVSNIPDISRTYKEESKPKEFTGDNINKVANDKLVGEFEIDRSRPVSEESTLSTDSATTVIFNDHSNDVKMSDKDDSTENEIETENHYATKHVESKDEKLEEAPTVAAETDSIKNDTTDKSVKHTLERPIEPTHMDNIESDNKLTQTVSTDKGTDVKTNVKIDKSDTSTDVDRKLEDIKEQSDGLVTDVIDTAAIKIQKFFKGFKDKNKRKEIESISETPELGIEESDTDSHSKTNLEVDPNIKNLTDTNTIKDESATKIQKTYKGYRVRRDLKNQLLDDDAKFAEKENDIDKEITHYLQKITEPIRNAFMLDKTSADENKIECDDHIKNTKQDASPSVYIPLRDYSTENNDAGNPQDISNLNRSNSSENHPSNLEANSLGDEQQEKEKSNSNTSHDEFSTPSDVKEKEVQETVELKQNKDPSIAPKEQTDSDRDIKLKEEIPPRGTEILGADNNNLIEDTKSNTKIAPKEELIDKSNVLLTNAKLEDNKDNIDTQIAGYINSIIEPIKQAFSPAKVIADSTSTVEKTKDEEEPKPVYIPLRDYSSECDTPNVNQNTDKDIESKSITYADSHKSSKEEKLPLESSESTQINEQAPISGNINERADATSNINQPVMINVNKDIESKNKNIENNEKGLIETETINTNVNADGNTHKDYLKISNEVKPNGTDRVEKINQERVEGEVLENNVVIQNVDQNQLKETKKSITQSCIKNVPYSDNQISLDHIDSRTKHECNNSAPVLDNLKPILNEASHKETNVTKESENGNKSENQMNNSTDVIDNRNKSKIQNSKIKADKNNESDKESLSESKEEKTKILNLNQNEDISDNKQKEPFYLHQDSFNNVSALSQEKAFADAVKNGTGIKARPLRNEVGDEKLLHSSEFHDSIPINIDQNRQTEVNEATKHTATQENRSTSTPTVLVHSGELHDNIIPLALQMNDVQAGAEIVTSGTHASVSVDAQASQEDVSACKDIADTTHAQSDFSMETEKRINSAIVKKNMESQAATKIQASFRGYQVRKQLKNKNTSGNITRRSARRKSSGRITETKRTGQNKNQKQIEEESATKIQAGIRGFLVRRRQKKDKKDTTPGSS